MKEYGLSNKKENNKNIQNINPEIYKEIHKNTVILCHDIVINWEGKGALLVTRKNQPAKGEIWPIGGRVERGISFEESLRKKVRNECNLELENIRELGHARTYFDTDPFDHGEGTDTLNIMCYGIGRGEIKLDKLHKDPIIITPEEYKKKWKAKLDPYVQQIMDLALPFLEEDCKK